ncbi:unnamed protein product [Trifolium pratense]|uniref:Uncharacterized protein n=1 Tax=Trifolium pratense TaxID=57577 RepID=A0ACB0LQI4_TRIPR|nr:unnamed protein product [Trifolium pratense]
MEYENLKHKNNLWQKSNMLRLNFLYHYLLKECLWHLCRNWLLTNSKDVNFLQRNAGMLLSSFVMLYGYSKLL